MSSKNRKKWVMLVGVATALLVLPRRSSQKASINPSSKSAERKNHKKIAEHN